MKPFSHWATGAQIFVALATMLGSTSAIAVPPWTEQAILPYFQSIAAVAVDGNLAATSSNDAVIIYRRGSDGAWTLEQTISVSRTRSVAVSSDPVLGEFVIVGSVQESISEPGGAVYIYTSNGSGSWSLQNTLRPAGLGIGDLFGQRIAFDGQTLVASAPGDDDRGTDAGAVYVFDGSSNWSLQDKVLPPTGRGDIFYGWAVDVSGDRIVVGARGDDSVATDAGSAFVYGRQADQTWAQLTELVGTGLTTNFLFGTSVAIDGNTVVVGTPGTGSIGANPQSVYVFVESGSWSQQTILQPPPFSAGGGEFATAVDISADTVVVGAARGNSSGFASGSAWVFGRSGTSWSQEQEITASDGAAYGFYGRQVAIDGSTIISSAPGTGSRASYISVGSDYVYQAPPRAEVSVRAIEVTQAVQDWNNSVTLIEGKTTVVRAFVELLPGEAVRIIGARLNGRRGSLAQADSPLTPVNGGRVTIYADIELRRGTLWGSFNFLLPSTWTSGNIDLELVLVDDAGEVVLAECNEPGGTTPDCAVSVSFTPSEELFVRIYSIGWRDADFILRSPTRLQLAEQLARIESAFPLNRVSVSLESLPPYSSKPDLSSTVDPDLETLRIANLALASLGFCTAVCDQDVRYYGLLVGAGSDASEHNLKEVDENGEVIKKKRTSTGYAFGKVASGFSPPGEEGRNGTGYSRNRVSHELAHTLGISHTIDSEIPLDNGNQVGSCGSKSDSDKTVFPNHALINVDANKSGVIALGGERAPVIGPLDGPLDAGVDSEIWGFDTRYLQDNVKNLAVIDPNETPPMMSYCNGGPHGRWISAFNYERLIGAIADPGPGSGSNGGDGDYLFVSGVMDADGTTVQNRPVIELSGTPVLPIAGAYRIALKDATGTELAAVDFEPIKGDTDAAEDDLNPDRQQSLFFIVPLLKPTVPIAEIIVSNNGVEISRVVASPNLPSVVITQPTVGQNLTTDTVTLAWQGSDADGDALTYTVQYSPDGGSSWSSLAVNTPIESYELERAYLAASTDARIRVAVSDGVNTSVTTSDAFTVANNGPLVLIKQPRTGLSFDSGQPVIFEAFAYDTEDSSIGDAAISWVSDIDGALGVGRELLLSTLTTGLHTITVTATDSAGTPSSKSIVLGIGVPLPDITVTNSITPANDQQMPFADLTVGGLSDQTVTLSNDGNADLVIGSIAQANALAAPFSMVSDTCSGQTVAASTSCSFDIRFAPTVVGAFRDSFDIPSNDPDENPVTVSVSGTGLAVVNIPPSTPVLVSPTDGQQGLATSVTLKWQPATDSDGDALSYDVYNCTDSDPVNNCTLQTQVASLNEGFGNGVYYASLGLGSGIMILGITFAGAIRSRRQTIMLVAIIALGSLLVSCGGGGGGGGGGSSGGGNNNDTKTYTVSGLSAGTTYYWVVVATDGKGGETPSAVWNFTTQ